MAFETRLMYAFYSKQTNLATKSPIIWPPWERSERQKQCKNTLLYRKKASKKCQITMNTFNFLCSFLNTVNKNRAKRFRQNQAQTPFFKKAYKSRFYAKPPFIKKVYTSQILTMITIWRTMHQCFFVFPTLFIFTVLWHNK